jgi:hypothetical protein
MDEMSWGAYSSTPLIYIIIYFFLILVLKTLNFYQKQHIVNRTLHDKNSYTPEKQVKTGQKCQKGGVL